VSVGEALKIDWTQVDPDARTIRVEDDQVESEKARFLPLPSGLVEILKQTEQKTGCVFSRGSSVYGSWTW